MTEHYAVALAGFTQFEREALTYCLQQAANGERVYELGGALSRSDFIVADGDSQEVVAMLSPQGLLQRTVFVGSSAVLAAGHVVPRPIDPLRIVSSLDELLAKRRSLQFTALQAPADAAHERRWAAREGARAASRRARHQMLSPDAASAPGPHDVLVLDTRDADRLQLCQLLGGFGFQPHPAQSLGEAARLSERCDLVAAFLVLGHDDAEFRNGAELCLRIKQAEREGTMKTAVVVIAATNRQTDRVRTLLAGGDTMLAKPVGRGEVARALETCGVRLPLDPRRR